MHRPAVRGSAADPATLAMLAAAAVESAAMTAPRLSAANAARLDRLSDWYLPGRFGLFFHYGPFTGGGSAADDSKEPIRFPTSEAFEAAAPEPREVARNMAAAAKDAGARYAILTVCHTCAGHVVLFPTERPEFLHRTRQDWVGAFLSECRAAGVMPMLYLPGDANNWNNPQTGPNVAPEVARDPARFAAATEALLGEMHARYGDAPAGFWLDGGLPPSFRGVPARIRALWPRAVVVANGASELDCDDVDMGTTEILGNPRTFLPPYDRPGAYRFFANGSRDGRTPPPSAAGGGADGVNRWNGHATPQTDFNEDVPSPHHWWFHGENEEIMPECEADRFFLLRTMLCSLGRRGRWNFAPGIGPRLDGTMPPRLRPQLDAIRDFLAWAGEAVYGTRGPAGTFLRAGWTELRGGRAFYAATVRLDDPSTCYAIFTELPSGGRVLVDTSGFEPCRATDLRTGRALPFRMGAGPVFDDGPWGDAATCGAAVVKLEF